MGLTKYHRKIYQDAYDNYNQGQSYFTEFIMHLQESSEKALLF